ncbi:L-lysine exporter [Alteromonas gracilis]
MDLLLPVGAGFVAGLSLIVAIGAQNALVLRQGSLRHAVAAVVGVCLVSDVVLILVGVAGAGAVVRAHPEVVDVMRWAGAAYLLWFALGSARAALRDDALIADAAAPTRRVVLTALGLTWLNPHVYLDTVVLLGSLSTAFAEERWWFGLGAVCASSVWFPGLALAGRALAPWLARPRTWRVVNGVIAVPMTLLALGLVLG